MDLKNVIKITLSLGLAAYIAGCTQQMPNTALTPNAGDKGFAVKFDVEGEPYPYDPVMDDQSYYNLCSPWGGALVKVAPTLAIFASDGNASICNGSGNANDIAEDKFF